MLAGIDIPDATLDSMTLATRGACVEAAAALNLDDATKMVGAWLASVVDAEEGSEETAPQPAPAAK